MPHIIRPEMPSVMTRAFDAFRATDSVTVGEAFTPHALMVTHLDPKLMSLVGLPAMDQPLRSRGNLDIALMFAHEFQAMQITYIELQNGLRVGQELAVTCDFEAKLLANGQTVAARCVGLYTLDKAGRKIEAARTVCKLITPGWDYTFN